MKGNTATDGMPKIPFTTKRKLVAEKIKRETEMSKQLEEKCKNLKNLERKRLTQLRNQLQEKQLEAEQARSKLTDTWQQRK